VVFFWYFSKSVVTFLCYSEIGDNVIAYIFKTRNNQIGVCENQNVYYFECTLNSLLNKLACHNLSTLSGRVDAIKKMLGYKSKVPIYIDESALFIPLFGVRSESAFLLNYHAITSYRKIAINEIIITFSGFHEMKLFGDKNFKKAFIKAKTITEYMENKNEA